MLVIGICLARLGCIEHNLFLGLSILAYKSAAARGRNHLVSVERQHAVFAESAEHLPVITRAEPLRSIFDYGNSVLGGNFHYPVYLIWHSIKRDGNDSFRLFACFCYSVDYYADF